MSTTIVTPVVSNPAATAASAVSWGAILAGALAAAAISLILFILGIGLGLTSISPWSGEGISGQALGISTIGWTTFTSLVASALGGYIAGRLRTRWVSVDQDEVYFRDTAHGFLAWGLATLITATMLTTVSAKLAATTASVAGDVAGATAGVAVAGGGAAAGVLAQNGDGANPEGGANGTVEYFLDSLFRRGPSASGTFATRNVTAPTVAPPQQAGDAATDQAPQNIPAAGLAVPVARGSDEAEVAALPEVTRIMVRGLKNETLAAEDRAYVAQLVSEHTGMSPSDAQARVDQVFNNLQTELREAEAKAKQVADEARAASAKMFLWFFVSLLIGAFIGSFVATFGGKQRDNVELRV